MLPAIAMELYANNFSGYDKPMNFYTMKKNVEILLESKNLAWSFGYETISLQNVVKKRILLKVICESAMAGFK